MKKLSVTIIHDPGPRDARSGVHKRDVVVDQVSAALASKGHRVDAFPLPSEVEEFVRGLRALKPDLIFNLAESFGDNLHHDYNIAAILEVMGIPFTGADTGGLYMSQDKVLTKKLLAFHNVPYPEFMTFAADRIENGGQPRFPLFVKPVRADASLGINASSLVHNWRNLVDRVEYVQEHFAGEALAEEYVDGREYYLSVIGHREPRVLSVVEMDFSGLPPKALPVASYDAKWNSRTRAYKGTKAIIADVPEILRSRLRDAARNAYLALRLRDYGRVDMRVTEGGKVYVIEVNPNPYLARDSEFAMAAWDSGIPYEELIELIVQMGWKRRRDRGPIITDVLAASTSGSGRVSANSPLEERRSRLDKSHESTRPAPAPPPSAPPPPPSEPPPAIPDPQGKAGGQTG